MHKLAVFSSLHLGRPLAAAIRCEDQNRTAWVGVYPLDLAAPLTRELLRNFGFDIFPETGRAYRIRTFEVNRSLIEEDRWISESDLINSRNSFAFDDDSLAEVLSKLDVPLECLELHQNSDYPI